jgi:aspartokinase/homoserine dehydrogenase 1
LRAEFAHDLAREAARISEEPDRAVIGLIGSGLDRAAPVLRALAAENVGVSAILPGASSGSLSCVVDAASCVRATRIAHRWCAGDRSVFGIALLGVGKVGSAVLNELHDHRMRWRQRGMDVRLVAIADSRRMLIVPDGVDLSCWRVNLETQGRRTELRELASAIADLALPAAAVLDCTADDGVVDAYERFVEANLHVVTPNKRASVLPWRRYSSLQSEFARRRRRWLDSATVGAGLPILSTLRDLVAGGDTITTIEGVLSGTLGFLFSCLDRGTPFRAAVEDARRQGLTEPDPREDLSGIDVARKILILARQAALPLELEDVDTETLVGYDDEMMRRRVEDARARGTVLRYVATLEKGRASAGLREVPVDHPLARTTGCDNTIAITSTRYATTPLVICGPGAGATITARAVIADLGKLLHETRG